MDTLVYYKGQYGKIVRDESNGYIEIELFPCPSALENEIPVGRAAGSVYRVHRNEVEIVPSIIADELIQWIKGAA